MAEAEYVFCKWKKRLWPAKVLSRNPASRKRDRRKDGSASVRVEIFGLQIQVDVSCAVVQPLRKETIEDISSKLAQRKQNHKSVEMELTYRQALKEALDLLDSASPSVGPLKKTPLARKDAPERAWSRLATTHKAPPERAKEQETEDVLPASKLAAIKNERVLRSVDSPRRGAVCPGHVDNVESEGRPCCGISKSKTRVGSKLPFSSKEDTKHLKALDASSCPASRCLTIANPAVVSPLRKGRTRTTKSQRQSLLSSPKLSEEGEVTAKGSDRNPLNGTPSQNHTTTSPTPKKQRRLRLEDLHLETLPEGPPFEREGEESWIPNGEPSAEAGEGLELSSDLSPSPVRGRSFSSDEEDEELPSFFLPQELGSIEEGKLVWYKIRGYPYWPAVVKNIKRKTRKAIVVFVEKGMESKGKGFSVCLRNLKHFDCEEKQAFINAAQENYKDYINWCINLIEDYRIRVGCNSFTGSLIEYCSDAMSFPVQNEGLPHLSRMNFPNAKEEEEEGQDTPSKATRPNRAKKLLPDRTRAARDRANQKLVDFIVKAQGADEHLQAILRRQKSSRWLAKFLAGHQRHKCIQTYLEDDGQYVLVYHYLEGVYLRTGDKVLPGFCRDRIRFILDVLFPEAIIYAIAAVDQIEYQKAEEKYSKGPPVSQREKDMFDEKILEELRAQKLQSEQSPSEDSP